MNTDQSSDLRLPFQIWLPTCLAACLLCLTQCTRVTPRQQRALDVFQCRVHALEPALGNVYNVEELVRDALAGKAQIGPVLQGIGATRDEVVSAAAAWAACMPVPTPELPPSGLPSSLTRS